ncbi:hypothetical protein SAMD00019534_110410, partial [Acytostelium subglobosum LB1]|uniref:hypothetical protein n=1 Tax=Acytostelium subglobosum LB1 TaxID=1410327 RepID=UPI00064486C6
MMEERPIVMEAPLVIEGQKVRMIAFPSETPPDAQPIIQRTLDVLKPKTAFVLDHVLSPSECKYIIDKGEEIGFDNLKFYKTQYRGNVRIMVSSHSLSATVFERIKQYLPDNLNISLKYDSINGKWKLHEVNEMWRLCKYNLGGAFAPHLDGNFVRDSDNRSYLTFMIYLSEGIDGGATRFLEQHSHKVVASVQPKVGSVLVFQHDMWHDGETVNAGLKYIMRTDVMYRRVDTTRTAQEQLNEQKARHLIKEAESLEYTNPSGAVSLLKQAYKIYPPIE